MIYCVIPRELEDELYEKMVDYYKDNPHVTVIVDRREGEDRRQGREKGGKREIRERRRARVGRTVRSRCQLLSKVGFRVLQPLRIWLRRSRVRSFSFFIAA